MRIHEIFGSLQSEASQVGMSATFIRFAGCNLSCAWCDEDGLIGKEMSVQEIFENVNQLPARLVVITGGESLIQYKAVEELVKRLHAHDYQVAIETNGTIPCSGIAFDHVVVSPKLGVAMKKAAHINATAVKQFVCDDLKIVENGQSDEELEALAKKFLVRKGVFLQPQSNNKKSIARCIDFVMRHPQWRLSFQLHKVIGIQ